LLRQAEIHRLKVQTLEGRKDTTHEYWLAEAERFEERAKQRAELLDKVLKKKKNEEGEEKE
jgi:ppGpp synthetase/RelA/SpoT-type nucleotidyltranferase